MPAALEKITVGAGDAAREIAVRHRAGKTPGIFWLGGFMSDMKGTKAQALDEWAAMNGHACTRFDYSGHGESSGRFEDGTISRWLEEAAAVFARTEGPQIVVGSSMGGWIALLLTQVRRATGADTRIAGLVLIAPAVDMTEELMWKKFPKAVRKEIETTGAWRQPSDYSAEPYLITRALIEDGRNASLRRQADRDRMPGAYFPGHSRYRRARRTCEPPAHAPRQRRRGSHAGEGR